MSAQPVHDEDPRDPQVILRDLPEREQAAFLQQYHEAVEAARDPAGYKRLAACLRMWGIRARLIPQVLAERPNYYEEVEAARRAVRDGTMETVPIEQAIADYYKVPLAEGERIWAEKVAEARAQRRTP